MSPDPGQRRSKRPSPSRISLETLVIAAAASVASAFVIAQIWGPGTLFGAAAAPVIVALVSEALRRPIHAVGQTTESRLTTTPSNTGLQASTDAPPVAVGPVTKKSRANMGRTGWRWALITGFVGFGIAVGVITVPDLISGSSITGNGRPTTFFGGATRTKTEELPASTTLTTTETVTSTTPTTTTATTSTTTTVPAQPTRTTPAASSTITTVTETASPTSTVPTTSPASVTDPSTTAPSPAP